MDGEERALFTRGVQDAVLRHTAIELDDALAELGWADALAADAPLAVTTVFEAQGRAVAASGALDVVVAAALGPSSGPVLLPSLGRTSPPGLLDGGWLAGRGLGSHALPGAGSVVVACTTGDRVALVEVRAGDLDVRAVGGLDRALGLHEVTIRSPMAATTPLAPGAWEAAVAAGQRALASELVGVAAAMLDLARDHAVERIQFGVPISSFQAVRHRLADCLVAVEAARGAVDAAWEGGGPLEAAAAKAIAGRSARTVARHAQQVLAGIGFTMEHPLHRYLRRTRSLDGLFGDSRTLTRELGERLLADRGLPAILPL